MKLVNYIREQVKSGNPKPDVSSRELFQDDCYLQPTLPDDALLFSLDDICNFETVTPRHLDPDSPSNSSSKKDASATVTGLEERMRSMQAEFDSYRQMVQRTLDDRWTATGTSQSASNAHTLHTASGDRDTDYFDSYSYNDIHETMLKDTIRTDSYRDFIYENKNLFQGKTVLDVGCGTGILSMFCARAGAAKVIAVDNSSIIDKAKANIRANKLEDTITCIRGKIEQVTLPVDSVDIIVSEWMGYCLLFEAMLDSVVWARDRYLRPDGLMVPSHCTLRISPITDQDYIADSVDFWHDVYGFNMTAMMENIYDDVLIRHLAEDSICAPASTFIQLSLHTVKVSDLSFTRPFSVTLARDLEALDGWCVYFDTFFLSSRSAELPQGANAVEWQSNTALGTAFTTGPAGKETHWRSGVMLIDPSKHSRRAYKQGDCVEGTVSYKKRNENQRGLDVELQWACHGKDSERKQTWFIS